MATGNRPEPRYSVADYALYLSRKCRIIGRCWEGHADPPAWYYEISPNDIFGEPLDGVAQWAVCWVSENSPTLRDLG